MSYDIVQESVPEFTKRIGDRVLQGSNNAILILGTDRAKNGPAGVDDGLGDLNSSVQGKGTGTAHLVVGRHDTDGNPDLSADDAYLYLSMNTMADTNLGLTGVEKPDDGKPSAIIKSDVVRTVFRSSLKLSDDGGTNYIYVDKDYLTANVNGFFVKIDKSGVTVTAGNGTTVVQPAQVQSTIGNTKLTLTAAAAEVNSPVIKISGPGATPWQQMFQQFLTFMAGHDHLTAVGPSTPATAGVVSSGLVTTLNQAFAQWQSTSFGS